MSFILAMVMNPSVQKKAQEEIDRVVLKGQLPTLEDKEALPYVTAVLWEVFRCWPVTAMGKDVCFA
jgi:cytochrome P450